MSKVHFASAKLAEMRAEASLPAKFKRMLEQYPMKEMFGGKTVAIKMHLGGNLGFTTIPTLFVKLLVTAVKDAGGRPFITDGTWAIADARDRGYTEEVLGAPVIPAAGFNEKYYVTVPIGYRTLEEADICGEIMNADAMIVLSHGKGHGHCGWGGAIKNIGMGNVTCKTRGAVHMLSDTSFEWNEETCTQCKLCVDNCPTTAASFDDKGKFNIFVHNCRYCMHCVTTCPQKAITINEEGSRYFQAGMAYVNKACLDTFEPNRVMYINYVMNVTPLCDCWGFSSPSIVPDVGILASTDIVAVEQASIDQIKSEDFIEGCLPPPLSMDPETPGHLFEKIHHKDPYMQCEELARLGLGAQEYELEEIK